MVWGPRTVGCPSVPFVHGAHPPRLYRGCVFFHGHSCGSRIVRTRPKLLVGPEISDHTSPRFMAALCPCAEQRIGREIGDEVFHRRFAVQKSQNFAGTRGRVESHRFFALGKASRTRRSDGANPSATCKQRIPRPPTAGHQVCFRLLSTGENTNHRQVNSTIVSGLVKSELLLSVRGIVGGIHIDGDPTARPCVAFDGVHDRSASASVRHTVPCDPVPFQSATE